MILSSGCAIVKVLNAINRGTKETYIMIEWNVSGLNLVKDVKHTVDLRT